MRPALIIALALIAAGCTRHDADHLRHDVSNVGADVGADIRHVGDAPVVRKAGADLHAAAHKADLALRQTGDEAKRRVDGHADRRQGN